MSVPFEEFADSPLAPSLDCYAITPSGTLELPKVTNALYVCEGADAVLRPTRSSDDVIFRNLSAGYTLDLRVRAVRASGTKAAALVGLA